MAKTRLAVEWGLLRAGERVCVAVSGGADSTALLLAMVEEGAERGLVVKAAHVHHGLRGAEADEDEAFVREVCERLDVDLRVFHVDTAARQQAESEGVEEAARALRYEALQGLLWAGFADVLLTAHTLDDQAETVVMKMLRGAWTEGLAGISPVLAVRKSGGPTVGKQILRSAQDDNFSSRAIVRPMLDVRRSEIEAWLRERGQVWREDSSNADRSLTRNRVRHELMPMLRTFNPSVDAALARTAEIAREEEAFWTEDVKRVLPQVLLPGKPVRGGGRAVSTAVDSAACAVEIARLAAMPVALQRRIVRAVAFSVGSRLPAEETAKVMALAGLERHAEVKGKIGSRLELAGGLRVERSAREIRFWRMPTASE